ADKILQTSQRLFIIGSVLVDDAADFTQVVLQYRFFRISNNSFLHWHRDCAQDGYDRDHDHQFQQGKSPRGFTTPYIWFHQKPSLPIWYTHQRHPVLPTSSFWDRPGPSAVPIPSSSSSDLSECAAAP